MFTKNKTPVLAKEDLERIHEKSLCILEKVGVVFHSSDAIDVFKTSGAKTEGKRVYLTSSLIEKALECCRPEISVTARNSNNILHIGTGAKYCLPMTGSVYVDDIENGRRKSLASDYINFVKLAQTSSMFQFVGGPMVVPGDIPEAARNAFMTIGTLCFSDKAVHGLAGSGRAARESIKLTKMLLGPGTDVVILGIANVTTPLVYDTDSIEAVLEYVKEGQAVVVSCCGMAGVTAPVTLAGTLAVNNAEVLAGIVFTQLVRPGTPVLYGNISVAGDMKTMGPAAGAPESALLTSAGSQMAKYYRLPCRAGGTLTDAIGCGFQAGYESAVSLLSAFLSDADLIAQSAGMTESFMTASYDKFILDEEIYQMVKRYVQGIEVNENTLAFETIKGNCPGGNFLDSDHTYSNFKNELTFPLTSNRLSYDNWSRQRKTPVDAAHGIWQNRLQNFSVPENSGIKVLWDYWKEKFGDIPESLKG